MTIKDKADGQGQGQNLEGLDESNRAILLCYSTASNKLLGVRFTDSLIGLQDEMTTCLLVIYQSNSAPLISAC